jgi:hypothetical protein
MSTENVPVRNALLLDGMFQGAGDVLLPDDIFKALRTVLARQDLITHGSSIIRYSSAPDFLSEMLLHTAPGLANSSI